MRGIVVDDHHLRLTVEIHARHAVLLSNANATAEKSVVRLGKCESIGRESVFGEKRITPKTQWKRTLPNYLREMPHSLILLSKVL